MLKLTSRGVIDVDVSLTGINHFSCTSSWTWIVVGDVNAKHLCGFRLLIIDDFNGADRSLHSVRKLNRSAGNFHVV